MTVLPAIAAFTLLAAPPAPGATERIAVLAVHEPAAPDPDLVELTHQLRAACAERVPGVLQAAEMRARLQGRTGDATASELDRAFNGALAVYQNGEYQSAERTLKAIVADLEELPEGEAVWRQWTRAMMRLSHLQFTMGQAEASDATQVALLKVDAAHQLDPMLYAPGYRAHFEELRARVRAMPRRRLTISSDGRDGTVYVGGREVGPTPATVLLPAGAYRVAGAAGELRPPSLSVDLAAEDRTVTLDFALAETVRIASGPALALPPGDRGAALVKAGAWLGVDRLVVTTRAQEGEAPFLVGAVYDVRRGALQREGSVRAVGGGVPAGSLGALAAFLLTGTPSRDVNDRFRLAARPAPTPATPAPAAKPARTRSRAAAPVAVASATAPGPTPTPAKIPAPATTPTTARAQSAATPARAPGPAAATASVATASAASEPPIPSGRPAAAPPDLAAHPPSADPVAAAVASSPASPTAGTPRPAWLKPLAIGSTVLAVGLAGVSVQQGRTASQAYDDAAAMVLPGGILVPGVNPADQAALVDRGDTASRNAWIAGSAAVISAAGAVVCWWLSP